MKVLLTAFFLVLLSLSGLAQTDPFQRILELYSQGHYREALPLAEDLVQRSRGEQGEHHLETARALHLLGLVQKKAGLYSESERHYRAAIEAYLKSTDPEHPETVKAQRQLANLLQLAGRYEEAETLARTALAADTRRDGEGSPETALGLNTLAGILQDKGALAEAAQTYRRALEISRRHFGPQDTRTGVCLGNLGGVLLDLGQPEEAERMFREALEISRATLPAGHPQLAGRLNNLAYLLLKQERFQEAESYAGEALHIFASTLGQAHPMTARALENTAAIAVGLEKFEEAETLMRQALESSVAALGSEHPQTVAQRNNLAHLLWQRGRFEEAEALYLQALESLRAQNDPLRLSTGLNNLAALYFDLGETSKARLLFEEALDLTVGALGPEHPTVALRCDNLARVYLESGDYSRAELMQRRALALLEGSLGPDHPELVYPLRGHAQLLANLDDLKGARAQTERALRITRHHYPPESGRVASLLVDLAGYHQKDDAEEAERTLREALRVQKKVYGERSAEVRSTLFPLTTLLLQQNRLAEARPLCETIYQISLALFGSEHPATAYAQHRLGSLLSLQGETEEAEPLFQAALTTLREKQGAALEQLQVLTSLTLLLHRMERHEEARDRLDEEAELRRIATESVFSFASLKERLDFRKARAPFALAATLKEPESLLTACLRYKGLVLDSAVEDAQLAAALDDPKWAAEAVRLRSLRERLGHLSQSGAPPEALSELTERLAAQERTLTRKLSSLRANRRSLSTKMGDVQRSLDRTSALVEFVVYRNLLVPADEELHYAAVVLLPQGSPRMVDLGEARDLASLVSRYRRECHREGPTPETLRALHDRVWSPLAPCLSETTKTVILSPDGDLNFLSFATLITEENRFLAEDYLLAYVSSGRDLLRPKESKAAAPPLLIGSPDFGGRPQQPTRSTGEIRGLNFGPLPHSEQECRAIAKLLPEARLLLGSEATERNLRSTDSPSVLHLATHGFFLSPQSGLRDPMLRSGIALSGAQRGLQARLEGLGSQDQAPDNDGVLSAAEAGLLKLKSTELVVLSACDTGAGESVPGEGVLGLRRGFVQAGAGNLLMTLWPISDEHTATFMEEFYRKRKEWPAPVALARLQRETLVRLREELGVSRACQLAGAFVLNFQGPLGGP